MVSCSYRLQILFARVTFCDQIGRTQTKRRTAKPQCECICDKSILRMKSPFAFTTGLHSSIPPKRKWQARPMDVSRTRAIFNGPDSGLQIVHAFPFIEFFFCCQTRNEITNLFRRVWRGRKKKLR